MWRLYNDGVLRDLQEALVDFVKVLFHYSTNAEGIITIASYVTKNHSTSYQMCSRGGSHYTMKFSYNTLFPPFTPKWHEIKQHMAQFYKPQDSWIENLGSLTDCITKLYPGIHVCVIMAVNSVV
jgi:hypothetical protein